MILRFKKHIATATAPRKSHPTDAGFDLTSAGVLPIQRPNVETHTTGIAVEIPEGYVGLLKERSSIRKRGLVLLGGVIDAGYTGIIEVSFLHNVFALPYLEGEHICQLVIVPLAQFDGVEEVSSLAELGDRGAEGFGSTGA
jgi:dUTP pyrophosphatase